MIPFRGRDLITVCRQLFGLSNLIGTDFTDVVAVQVSHEETESVADWTGGMRLEFTVSWDVIGKALDSEGGDALERLRTIAVDRSDTATVRVPSELLRQHELLERAKTRVATVVGALKAPTMNTPGDTARGAQMRIRMYALNVVGERLNVLIRLLERGNERAQTDIVRQLMERVALGAYKEPLTIVTKGKDRRVFARHRAPRETVKTYGDKFVLRGLSDLRNEAKPRAPVRKMVETLYANTSSFSHPSPEELFCFVEDLDGQRVATAPGIELYGDFVHAVVSLFCLKLNLEYDLRALSAKDIAECRQEIERRMNTEGRQ